MSIINFFRGNEGGFMDIIRCDEQDYLVKKWSPGEGHDQTKKENAIRYGSRIRVKPGEAAVFFYKKDDGSMVDIITGPADEGIKTANFPVLASIVGAAFGGDSPFMAEIYFVNLQQNLQIKFGIPYFDVFDARFPDLGVPCAVRGTMTLNVTDIPNFIKLYRLINFELSDLEMRIKDLFTRKIKSVILSLPIDTGLPLLQMERRLDDINSYVINKLGSELQQDFGVNLKRLDISAIEMDKNDPNYIQFRRTTADQQSRYIDARTGIEITNLEEMARINRKELEMGVEARNFAVHQLDLQADILKTAAGNLGEMGNMSGGGFSPAGMMAGMAIGGTMGSNIGGMMGNITNTPPPPPGESYHIAINGQQSGPYTIPQLKDFAKSGAFTKHHYVWKAGMAGWETAETVSAFAALFSEMPPPPPPASK